MVLASTKTKDASELLEELKDVVIFNSNRAKSYHAARCGRYHPEGSRVAAYAAQTVQSVSVLFSLSVAEYFCEPRKQFQTLRCRCVRLFTSGKKEL